MQDHQLRNRDKSGGRKSPLRMSQDVSQLYPRNKVGRQVVEDRDKMHMHSSYAKLDMHPKPIQGPHDLAKSHDKFDQKAAMPQSGQTMTDNRRDSNYANQTGEAKKQKLVYSSAAEILNNNPKAQARDRDLSNTHKKKTPNPLQKSV